MNNDDSLVIKQETREKIQKAIDSLHYRPNSLARSLRTKKSNLQFKSRIYPILFLQRLYKEHKYQLQKKNYFILCKTNDDENIETENIKMFYDKAIDGILVASIYDFNVNLKLLLDLDMKFVLIE